MSKPDVNEVVDIGRKYFAGLRNHKQMRVIIIKTAIYLLKINHHQQRRGF